jgi:hypothetical protein
MSKKNRRVLPMDRDMRIGIAHMIVIVSLFLVLTVTIAVLPREMFQRGLPLDAANVITAYWPKLSADREALNVINPSYAEKFVISYFLLAATAALMWAVSSLHLLFLAFRWQFQVERSFDFVHASLACVLSTTFLVWWTIFLPTPFRDEFGFSTKYPSWELNIIYCALFFFGLWGSLVILLKLICFLFFGFKKSSIS